MDRRTPTPAPAGTSRPGQAAPGPHRRERGRELWEVLLQHAPVALSLIDLSGRQLAGNEAHAAMFGYTVEELRALDVACLTHPDDRERTAAYLDRLARGDVREVVTEKRYLRKDGSEFPGRLRASLLTDEDGAATAIIGVIDDLSDRQAAENARAAAERKYERVLGAQRELVCEWSPDGTIVYVNEAYRRFFGYGPDVVGRNLFELLPVDGAKERSAFLRRMGAGAPDHLVRRHYDDGRVVSWSDTVVRDACDLVVSVVSVGRDVTERTRIEDELARRRDEALELSRLRSELIATVSHELRNPLHGILGLTELLASSALPPAERAMAQAVHRQAGAMRRTVGDLMDLGRLQAGAFDLVSEVIELRQVIADTVCPLLRNVPAAVVLRAHVDDGVPDLVRADGARLAQVLGNLVGNAVAATHDGSVAVEVDVVANAAEVGPRPEPVTGPGRGLRFRVTDTGVGIEREHLELIFEPFARVPGTRPGSAGAGLGLAVVRQLVDLMGGTVTVTSAPGAGSTFTVTVPLHPVSSEDAAGRGAAGPAAAAPCTRRRPDQVTAADGGVPGPVRVLVVEDDPVNQLVAAAQLGRLGATVHLADDGATALALHERLGDDLDLVFMDFCLPDLDGFEVTRRLRARGGRRVPVVGMSASALPEDRAASLAAGMDDFVPKPAGFEEVRSAVARWTATQEPAVGTSTPSAVGAAVTVAAGGSTPSATRVTARGADEEKGGAAGAVELAALDQLGDELGDRSVAAMAVRSFVDLLPERMATLRAALERGDLDCARRTAHVLRPSALRFGAAALAERCARIEGRVAPGPAVDLAEVTALGASTGNALARWLDRVASLAAS